jgi:hypothetical protein
MAPAEMAEDAGRLALLVEMVRRGAGRCGRVDGRHDPAAPQS